MSILSGFRENQVVNLYDLPPLVKQAKDEAFSPPQKLAAFFADPIGQEYPCHNAPATLLSTALLLHYGRESDRFQPVLDKLASCASHFGIRKEYDNLIAKDKEIRETDLNKLADDQFALVMTVGGKTIRQYPVRNAVEVKAAAEYLKKNRNNFRFEDRHKIARRILVKAQEFGVDEVLADETVVKTAGIALVNGKSVSGIVRKIASLLPPKEKAKAHELATTLDKYPLIDNETATKTAAVLDSFCNDFKIKYGPIEDEIFMVTRGDLERVKQSFVAFGGEVFNREDLNKLGQETAVGLIGDRAKCLFSVLPIKPTADDPKMASLLATSLKTAGVC